jgi:hypothetical protein
MKFSLSINIKVGSDIQHHILQTWALYRRQGNKFTFQPPHPWVMGLQCLIDRRPGGTQPRSERFRKRRIPALPREMKIFIPGNFSFRCMGQAYRLIG